MNAPRKSKKRNTRKSLSKQGKSKRIDRDKKIPKKRNWKRYMPGYWPAYNKAKTEGLPIFCEMLNKALDEMELPSLWKGNGRPPLDLKDMLKCLAIKVREGEQYRATIPHLHMWKKKLKIKTIPHFNTLQNYMVKPEITPLLEELLTRTYLPLNKHDGIITTDATGFGTSIKEHWIDVKKRKASERKKFVKLCAISSAKFNATIVARIIPGKRHESPHFVPMVKRAASWCVKIKGAFPADPGYLSRKNCEIIEKVGGTPYILPKKNSRSLSRGSTAWRRNIKSYKEDKENFLRHYHKRSTIEGLFSAVKRKPKSHVMSRKFEAQSNEILFVLMWHNFFTILFAHYLYGIDVL